MLKVYGIHGQTTAIIKIPINDGKAWLECEFKRGRIAAGPNNRPATFPTSDPAIQSIIESSIYFGRVITIVRTARTEDDNVVEKKVATVKDYPDVMTEDEAIAFLKAHGAKATELRSAEAIKKFMAKNNITFSNYSF